MAEIQDTTPTPGPDSDDFTAQDLNDAFDKDAAFDPAYVPPHYDPPAPDASVAWRAVIVDGQEIAIVWTDYQQGAGIMWVDQPDSVTQLYQFFQIMKRAGVAAGAAYSAATSQPHIEFGEEQTGTPADLVAREQQMMQAAT